VAIPFWAKLGDTAVLTKRLLELLVPQEPGVEKAWATHISGQLCHALGQYSNRFADSTITRIETFVGELKFAASTQLDYYQLDPDLGRALNRINQILVDRRFEPVEKNLLAARNAAQSSAELGAPPTLSSKPSVRVMRDYSHPNAPLPVNLHSPKNVLKNRRPWISHDDLLLPGIFCIFPRRS
jgi:hypothetical protein